MKLLTFPLIALAFALFSPPALGGDVYRASMDGCTECGNCKKKVVMSFADLQGVETVRFLKEKKNGLAQVIIETDGAKPLTKEIAIEVLKVLPNYELKKWEQVVPST